MTRFLHSRTMLVLASLLLAACAIVGVAIGGYPAPLASSGIVTGWSGLWDCPQPLSMILAMCANVGIAALLSVLNKRYNLLRCLTMLQGTFFLFMQMASPQMLACVNAGLALCLAWLACAMLLFPNFTASMPQRQVFLAFAILSALSAWVGEALIFVPGLWVACAQMRIMNLRTLLASLIGLACPWVIFFGFMLVSPGQIAWPEIFDFSQPFEGLDPVAIGVLSLTVFLCAASWVQNFMKYVSYTAKYRAYQGYVTMSMVLAVLGIAFNFADGYALMPILNACCALQLAHLFGVIHRTEKSYIAILVILIIYLFLSYPFVYLWKMIVSIL